MNIVKGRGYRMKILMYSWTGNGNIGDEAILYATTKIIRKEIPSAKIFALTNNPISTTYFVPHVIPLQNSLKPHKLLQNFYGKDAFFIAGGQIVHQKSIFNITLFSSLSKVFGSRVFVNSVGVHEIKGWKKMVAKYLSNICDSFTVRDERSLNNFKKISNNKIKLLPDPAFAIGPEDRCKDCKKVFRKYIKSQDICSNFDGPIIGISLREYGDNTNDSYIRKNIVNFCRERIKQDNCKVIFFPMMQGVQNDFQICHRVAEEIGAPENVYVIDRQPRIPELLCLLHRLDCLIGTRLHSLILATTQYVPIIALSHYWKVEELMKTLGLEKYCLPDNNFGEKIGDLYELAMKRTDNLKRYNSNTCAKFWKNLRMEYHNQLLQVKGECEKV